MSMLRDFPAKSDDDGNLFESTSDDKPTLLAISFKDSEPNASLGAQLVNCDKFSEAEMFLPGFAMVGRLLDGDTVARRCGVQVGDCIIAVNGQGFRRFAPDYKDDEVEHLDLQGQAGGDAEDADAEDADAAVELDHRVVKAGTAYQDLLKTIKAIKSSQGQTDSPGPLILSLERYGWDSRANAWGRFLSARDMAVPDAMQMLQEHIQWRESYFPISLTNVGMQRIFRDKVVCEIDLEEDNTEMDKIPPTVYVNYGRLLAMQADSKISPEDVVSSFVICTERMLARSADPRHAKTCQFIDLSGMTFSATGFRVDVLKQVYKVFEANYPETLAKMVIYPVSKMLVRTA